MYLGPLVQPVYYKMLLYECFLSNHFNVRFVDFIMKRRANVSSTTLVITLPVAPSTPEAMQCSQLVLVLVFVDSRIQSRYSFDPAVI